MSDTTRDKENELAQGQRDYLTVLNFCGLTGPNAVKAAILLDHLQTMRDDQ